MVIEKSSRCVKIDLPNGKVVDVLSAVIDEMHKWIQDEANKPESGGYIVGYQHKDTGNISLESVSKPGKKDLQSRIFFGIRDPIHSLFLKKDKRQKSYYMGVWHTHPQTNPIPSNIDWDDWNETLRLDKSGSQFIFFVITGTEYWRMWIGDTLTGKIVEGYEREKDAEGIYVKEEEDGA